VTLAYELLRSIPEILSSNRLILVPESCPELDSAAAFKLLVPGPTAIKFHKTLSNKALPNRLSHFSAPCRFSSNQYRAVRNEAGLPRSKTSYHKASNSPEPSSTLDG
jgi:hypothetical protein